MAFELRPGVASFSIRKTPRSENKELDAALLALETKHRAEDYLKTIGADTEAAKLIASAPDIAKLFTYDGRKAATIRQTTAGEACGQ